MPERIESGRTVEIQSKPKLAYREHDNDRRGIGSDIAMNGPMNR